MTLYLLKTILATALFLGVYYAFLSTEKMFRFNRFYLLFALIGSLAMPMWVSNTEYIVAPLSHLSETTIPQSLEHHASIEFLPVSVASSMDWIWTLYLAGVGLMFLAFLYNCGKIIRLIAKGDIQQKNGAKLVLSEYVKGPFSFLHLIFLHKKTYQEGAIEDSLLKHELTHVRQGHTIDNLLVELIHCAFWFNPLLIFYKKAIRLNHEFLADEAVLASSLAPETYLKILIQQAGRGTHNSMASYLNYGETKKRLNMMLKQSNPNKKLLKQVMLLPFFVLACWMFGQSKTIYQETNPIAKVSPSTESISEGLAAKEESEILYDLNLDGKGGMMAYFEVDGKENSRRVKAAVGPLVKISFTNSDGSKVSKLCKDLTEDERKWFWKLDQSQPSVFRLPRPQNAPKPTEVQMTDFLNSKKYGMWIDGLRVKNEEIKNYSLGDIHHMFKSGLERNAAHYGQYTYHLSLYTQKWFDKKYAGKKSGWWEKVELNGGWYYNKLN